MSELSKLVTLVARDLLAQDGQTTPDMVAAEVRSRYPNEVFAAADALVQTALTTQAHDCLRDSVKRVTSKQLALRLHGYDLPRAVPVRTKDGTLWRDVRGVTLPEWLAWLADREAQITSDSLSVDVDRDFGLFLQANGFSDTVTVEGALARAGITL